MDLRVLFLFYKITFNLFLPRPAVLCAFLSEVEEGYQVSMRPDLHFEFSFRINRGLEITCVQKRHVKASFNSQWRPFTFKQSHASSK